MLVCSDIHVLGSPPMSAEATRMQDLASEFSKIFRGVIPRTPTAGGGDPLPHPPPARPKARGASAPVLGPKPWSPSTFQPWLRPCCTVTTVGRRGHKCPLGHKSGDFVESGHWFMVAKTNGWNWFRQSQPRF